MGRAAAEAAAATGAATRSVQTAKRIKEADPELHARSGRTCNVKPSPVPACTRCSATWATMLVAADCQPGNAANCTGGSSACA